MYLLYVPYEVHHILTFECTLVVICKGHLMHIHILIVNVHYNVSSMYIILLLYNVLSNVHLF